MREAAIRQDRVDCASCRLRDGCRVCPQNYMQLARILHLVQSTVNWFAQRRFASNALACALI